MLYDFYIRYAKKFSGRGIVLNELNLPLSILKAWFFTTGLQTWITHEFFIGLWSIFTSKQKTVDSLDKIHLFKLHLNNILNYVSTISHKLLFTTHRIYIIRFFLCLIYFSNFFLLNIFFLTHTFTSIHLCVFVS